MSADVLDTDALASLSSRDRIRIVDETVDCYAGALLLLSGKMCALIGMP